MPTDPYTPPASSPWDTDAPQEKIWQTTTSAREIVKGWEKRRLYFNGILLLPGIGILLTLGVPASEFIGAALTFGIMGNIAFCLGPLTELYACAITSKPEQPKLRNILFGLGLGGSLILFLFIYLGVTA